MVLGSATRLCSQTLFLWTVHQSILFSFKKLLYIDALLLRNCNICIFIMQFCSLLSALGQPRSYFTHFLGILIFFTFIKPLLLPAGKTTTRSLTIQKIENEIYPKPRQHLHRAVAKEKWFGILSGLVKMFWTCIRQLVSLSLSRSLSFLFSCLTCVLSKLWGENWSVITPEWLVSPSPSLSTPRMKLLCRTWPPPWLIAEYKCTDKLRRRRPSRLASKRKRKFIANRIWRRLCFIILGTEGP